MFIFLITKLSRMFAFVTETQVQNGTNRVEKRNNKHQWKDIFHINSKSSIITTTTRGACYTIIEIKVPLYRE